MRWFKWFKFCLYENPPNAFLINLSLLLEPDEGKLRLITMPSVDRQPTENFAEWFNFIEVFDWTQKENRIHKEKIEGEQMLEDKKKRTKKN